ncbi:glycosyltransferase [Lactobacillus sp. ESL0785]|uniref:glycosyltransferase n=1 Tax=Lactobacillus sp. ESL0785 TaxID=2983232 RepID=UPI0023F62AFC|nr:glycosyltransferase [Lactobacillus sp. ESL0785]WEV71427.1 glycosyltransferase [Lactobacillus sp. ESL0785]
MDFFINQAMGLGNSGVEHAEFYRAKRFKDENIPYKFVFVSLVPELHQAMKKWHLHRDEVINMWEYFTLGEKYLADGLPRRTKPKKAVTITDSSNTIRLKHIYTDSGMHIVEHFVKEKNKQKPESKVLVVRVFKVEIFNAKTNELKATYEITNSENVESQVQNIHLFNQAGHHLFFANLVKLHRYFFEILDRFFGGQSNFYIDRGDFVDEALVPHKIPNSKIIGIIHADHLADRNDPTKPLWNNYYEYMFRHLEGFDRIVVATELQRQDILVDFPKEGARFVTIPVGGLTLQQHHPHKTELKSLKLITASRLAAEKHIDIAIKAVVALHNAGQKISFAIYGQGEKKDELAKLIKDNHAEDYIELKGLSDSLAQIYPQYDAFISTSFSEGFGLTYIEALNAGLPVVTFKARFGSMAMIKDGQNGFLQELKRDDDQFNVDQIIKGLNRLLAADYPKLCAQTQVGMEKFSNETIARSWRKLVDGLRVS